MELFQDALQSLKENRVTVLMYTASAVVVLLAYRVGHWALDSYYAMDNPPAWLVSFTLFSDLLLAAAISAIQAVFFAEIGKNIDRPLWKCSGPREAFARFFTPWLILNLFSLMLANLEIRAARNDNIQLVFTLEFFILILCLFFMPVGACIMHSRRLNWQELPETLMPIIRVYPMMAVVFLLCAGQYMVHFYLNFAVPAALVNFLPFMSVVDAGLALWDCLLFAAMWRVCIIYRSAPPEDRDFMDW